LVVSIAVLLVVDLVGVGVGVVGVEGEQVAQFGLALTTLSDAVIVHKIYCMILYREEMQYSSLFIIILY